MEPWQVQLSAGEVDTAWDLFIETYRPLILKTIRHTLSEPDAVMDAFAHVCAALSADGLARVLAFHRQSAHTAKFSTWLVVVVRNQTIDCLRKETGRPRVRIPDQLSELERRVFELVFVEGVPHVEAYEHIRAERWPDISFSTFLKALRQVYRARGSGSASARPRVGAATRPLVDESPLADELVAEEELHTRVRAALEILQPEQRLALQLFVLDGVGATEVARILGWRNAKTVYNRVYRALAVLRLRLEQEGITRPSG